MPLDGELSLANNLIFASPFSMNQLKQQQQELESSGDRNNDGTWLSKPIV